MDAMPKRPPEIKASAGVKRPATHPNNGKEDDMTQKKDPLRVASATVSAAMSSQVMDKTAGHTPGPWFVSVESRMGVDGDEIALILSVPHQPTEDGKGQTYVHVCSNKACYLVTPEERLANAYLMAAAPDLQARVLELSMAVDHAQSAADELLHENKALTERVNNLSVFASWVLAVTKGGILSKNDIANINHEARAALHRRECKE